MRAQYDDEQGQIERPRRTYERRRRSTSAPRRRRRQQATALPSSTLTRFDLTVILTLALLLVATGLVAWRGDQVGVQATTLTPADGAQRASVRSEIRITFDQPIAEEPPPSFTIRPAVDVRVRRNGNALVLTPVDALQPNTTYEVTVDAGLVGRPGRTLLEPVRWQFTTGQPHLVYVAEDAGNRQQLFAIEPDGTNRRQVTNEDVGIWGEFAVSPNGQGIAYAAQRPDGGNDLWAYDMQTDSHWPLLLCGDDDCVAPAWVPSGERIIYERRTINPAGVPRLWWLVVESGETAPVFQDSQQIGLRPTVSPDGRWISYVAPDDEGVRVLNVDTGDSVFVPSQMGEPAVWSPTSDAVLVTSIKELEEGYYLHILRADLATGTVVDLSGEAKVDDRTPRWSPDGHWIAFWRRHIDTAEAESSDELWIMRPDGSDARSVYIDPDVQHSPPEWSPDSRFVVFERYPLTASSPQSQLWLVDVQTGDVRELVTPGTRPAWVP